jgi:hypothetical protein
MSGIYRNRARASIQVLGRLPISQDWASSWGDNGSTTFLKLFFAADGLEQGHTFGLDMLAVPFRYLGR